MNRLLLASLAALCLAASPLAAQTASDSVRALDRALAQAYAVHDTTTAQSLLTRDILITNSAGAVKTREQELNDIRPAAGLVMRYFRTQNVDVHVHGNSATVIGVAEWEFNQGAQTRSFTRRYTATYGRGGPLGWQITALHFFPAPAAGAAVAPVTGTGIEGRWEGAIGSGAGRLRLALEITRAPDGLVLATLTSIDQGGARIPIERVRHEGDSVHLDVPAVAGTYHGALTADRTQIAGTWSQQNRPTPLTFARSAATAATSALSSAPSSSAPAAAGPFGLLLELDVPGRPTLFASGGKQHLAYEIHITNFSGSDLLLSRLEALDGSRTLVSYQGAELAAILQPVRPNVADSRSIPAGARTVAFVWITLDSGAGRPTSIRQRLSAAGQTLESDAVAIAAARPIVVGSPLRGAGWRAANGPGNTSGHRRALIPLAGRPAIAQRFAIDWVQVGANGTTFSGDARDNKSYHAYGDELLAVANGIVSVTKDGIPENIPGPTSRAVPITLETIGGNHVIIDVGGGRYAFYAHLQPGSLRVKAGDRVRRGQVIGLLGNSGNSTEPHLHFHMMDGRSPLGSEGLPYVIDAWDLETAPGTWERRQNQLPLQDARVRFPSVGDPRNR